MRNDSRSSCSGEKMRKHWRKEVHFWWCSWVLVITVDACCFCWLAVFLGLLLEYQRGCGLFVFCGDFFSPRDGCGNLETSDVRLTWRRVWDPPDQTPMWCLHFKRSERTTRRLSRSVKRSFGYSVGFLRGFDPCPRVSECIRRFVNDECASSRTTRRCWGSLRQVCHRREACWSRLRFERPSCLMCFATVSWVLVDDYFASLWCFSSFTMIKPFFCLEVLVLEVLECQLVSF